MPDTATGKPAAGLPVQPPAESVERPVGAAVVERPVGASSRLARFMVLAATFGCAACGLVYELALIAQGSYLLGDSITQASVVLSVMVFAMGLGALLAKPLQRRAVLSFAVVELVLAVLGGLSVLGLYAAFAWLDLYWPTLVAVALVLGLLIGAEIPLLMALLQRIRRQEAGSAVADLFAADYIGALLGGLAFPFLLLPLLGQIRGALVVGMVNAVAGCGLVLGVFRAGLPAPARRAAWAAGAAVIALLAGVFAVSERVEDTGRQQLYDDPIVHAERSRYQEIVITESVGLRGHDVRLFLNGDLQFSSVDEYRYHEALVHPAMAGRHARVLILGGGDGLAAREVLRYADVRELVEVELDPAVIRLARTDPRLTALNRHAMADSRLRVVVADAFGWLRGSVGRFDVVIIDMPDPDAVSTAKLYSTEFYGMARRALAEHGRLAVQASSPYFAPRTFSCVVSTVRAAGLGATPYHVDVPTFGDWGFVLAQAGSPPPLELSPAAPELRSLDPPTLSVAGVFPKDRRPTALLPSTLDKPRILRYSASDWGAS